MSAAVASPVGGVGASVLGSELGPQGAAAYRELKSVFLTAALDEGER